jgi:hypothetical protein
MQLKDKREEIVNTSLGIQVAAHLGLMLGTIGAIVPAAFNYALNDVGLPLMYANILAAMVGGIAAKAVDGGLKKYLPYTVAWLAGGEDKDTGAERMKVFNWLVLLICLVQLLTTFYMNLAVTPDVVQYATGDADVSDQERRLTSQEDIYRSGLSSKDEAVQMAKDNLQAAKDNAAAYIATAQASKGAEMARLAAGGNGWAKNEIAGAVASAKRKGDQELKAAQKELSTALRGKDSYVEKNGTALSGIAATITGEIAAVEDAHKSKQGRWNKSIVLFNIVCLIGFIIATIIVVLWEVEEGRDVRSRPTLGNVAAGIGRKTHAGTINTLRKIFRLDNFVGAPALSIAGYGPVPVDVRTQNRKTERPTPKTECKTGKCPPKSEKTNSDTENQHRETQRNTEYTYTEQDTEHNQPTTAQNRVGVMWPTPSDLGGWVTLCKKARGWSMQALEAEKPETKEKNLKKWGIFSDYARSFGYRCERSEDTGRAVISLDPAPIMLKTGVYEFNVAPGSESVDVDSMTFIDED